MIKTDQIKLITYYLGNGYMVIKLVNCPGDIPERLYLLHTDFDYLHPLPLENDDKIDLFIRKHIQNWVREYCAIMKEASGMERSGLITIIQNLKNINAYSIVDTNFFIIVVPIFNNQIQDIVDTFWIFHKQYIESIGMFGLEKGSYDLEIIIENNSPEYIDWYKKTYLS